MQTANCAKVNLPKIVKSCVKKKTEKWFYQSLKLCESEIVQ